MIVLHENVGYAVFREFLLVIALEEESTSVGVDLRPNKQHARYFRPSNLQNSFWR